MREFNELQSTNEYLVDQLIMSRKTNDLMLENNRKLENLLTKTIADLKACNKLLDELSESVNNLYIKRVKRMLNP